MLLNLKIRLLVHCKHAAVTQILPLYIMPFPNLNVGSRLSVLTAKFLQSKSASEAESIYFSQKGSILRSRLKKNLIAAQIDGKNEIFGFLLRPPAKDPRYLAPNPQTYLQPRLAKWQQISDNLAKMDSVILKEYRERRADFKAKSKKNNNPF